MQVPTQLAQIFGTSDPMGLFMAIVRGMRVHWLQVTDRVVKRSGQAFWTVSLRPGQPGAPAGATSARIPLKGSASDSDPVLALKVAACFAAFPNYAADEARRVAYGSQMGIDNADRFNLDEVPQYLLDETEVGDGGVISGPVLIAIIGAVVTVVASLIPIVLPMLMGAASNAIQFISGGAPSGGGSGGGSDSPPASSGPSPLLFVAAGAAVLFFL